MINVFRNRRCGPGGGTRHLHQKSYGGELGSTCVIKGRFSLGIVPPYRAKHINAKNMNAFGGMVANLNASNLNGTQVAARAAA